MEDAVSRLGAVAKYNSPKATYLQDVQLSDKWSCITPSTRRSCRVKNRSEIEVVHNLCPHLSRGDVFVSHSKPHRAVASSASPALWG